MKTSSRKTRHAILSEFGAVKVYFTGMVPREGEEIEVGESRYEVIRVFWTISSEDWSGARVVVREKSSPTLLTPEDEPH